MADQQKPERPVRKNNRPGSPNGNKGDNGMRFGRGLMGWFLVIGVAVALIVLVNQRPHSEKIGERG